MFPQEIQRSDPNTVREIVETAFAKQKKLKDLGQTVSDVGAIAITFRENGRATLLTLPRVDKNIAPDIDSYLASLNPRDKQRFLQGAGQIIIGNVMYCVELGIWNGWSNEDYISYFDESSRGTPIPTLSSEPIAKRNYPNPSDETRQIINYAKNDRTLQVFLDDSYTLPRLVATHLNSFGPYLKRAINEAVILYKDVLKAVKPQK